MSRCFLFPPPGYVRSSGDQSDQPLIESIKLQKEKERGKKEKKEKKKREKKEKSKDLRSSEHKNRSHKKRKHGEVAQLSSKDGVYMLAKEHATEQLEKSGLTEDNGPPAFIQNLYDSDGTQDCLKKQKIETPNVSHVNKAKSTVLHIRLPLMKLRDGEFPSQKPTLVSQEDAKLPRFNDVKLPLVKHNDAELFRPSYVRLSSFKHEDADLTKPHDLKYPLGRNKDAELLKSNYPKLPPLNHKDVEICRANYPKLRLVKAKHTEHPRPSLVKHKDAAHDLKLRLVKHEDVELCTHNLKQPLAMHKDAELPVDEPCISGRVEAPGDSTSCTHFKGSPRVRKLETKFRDLIMPWKPPHMDYLGSSDSDGLDWLLDSRKHQSSFVVQMPVAICKATDNVSAARGSLQMRACYVPDNDIYALPYIVPY